MVENNTFFKQILARSDSIYITYLIVTRKHESLIG